MRRVFAAIVALIAALAIAGCDNTAYTFEDLENKDRFNSECGLVSLVTDTRTGVQYLVWRDSSRGGICVLVDKNGKPMLAGGAE